MTNQEINMRIDELDAQLSASGKAWRNVERRPDRDHLRIWRRWQEGRTVIGLVATHCPMAQLHRYEALYGAHPAELWWCYEPPPGVEVTTEEPDGWDGWRP